MTDTSSPMWGNMCTHRLPCGLHCCCLSCRNALMSGRETVVVVVVGNYRSVNEA